MKCVIDNETPNYLSGQHKYTNKQAIFLVLKKRPDKHNETPTQIHKSTRK